MTGIDECGTQPLARRETVFSRQHQVKHDNVEAFAFELASHFGDVRDCNRRQAKARQVIGDQRANFGIVIND